ncbi:MAG: alkaline phosphatase D family protein [Proteobacteria bacterium]|nr:alkaline phosphatase D family protein [Pseudomonadota bacterium]
MRAVSTATTALAAPWLPACGALRPGTDPLWAGALPFAHGVASGDPLADRVILWTRVTPPPDRASGPIPVRWRLARDPGFRDVAAWGSVTTGPARDYTVKVDPVGLEPGRAYYYQFAVLDRTSPIGRTRTLPSGSVDRVRLAFTSCANYPQGYFNTYAMMAARSDLDAVLHLGDYFYEYENGAFGDGTALGRLPEPAHETVSLSDYRTRHAQYKGDPDLQALHRQHPVIAVWDDHESANDSWKGGAENHDPEREGAWSARKAAAIRAYLEWMPVREAPADGDGRIYRSFRFGDLADLIMLDTRLEGRDEHAPRDDRLRIDDPRRSLLGPTQEAWLAERLRASQQRGAAWRVLGQQVMFAPLARPGRPVNPDQWDGYPASRSRVLDLLEGRGNAGGGAIDDVVILTGDIHSSWALDVPRDPFDPRRYDPATGRGSRAVEFVTPAAAAAPLGAFERVRKSLDQVEHTHPHVRFMDLDERGYVLLDLDAERAQAEWYFVDTVEERRAGERFGGAFAARRGEGRLTEVREPSPVGAAV